MSAETRWLDTRVSLTCQGCERRIRKGERVLQVKTSGRSNPYGPLIDYYGSLCDCGIVRDAAH